MNKVDTTQIVDPTSQQPLTGKSIKFIQDATLSVTAALARAAIGANYDYAKIYVLNRCTITANVIANGQVFYQDEIYNFIGADTTAFANVPVILASNSNDFSIDPVMFSDGVNKNVHQVRTLYIADGLTGSGLADYADVVFIHNNETTVLTPASSSVATGYLTLPGSTFTGPDHKYNVKVRIEGDVRVPFATDGKISWATNVTNTTAATNYGEDGHIADNTAIIAAQTRTFRYVATRYITGLAAGTVLDIRQRNQQTDAHVFENIVLTYEVY